MKIFERTNSAAAIDGEAVTCAHCKKVCDSAKIYEIIENDGEADKKFCSITCALMGCAVPIVTVKKINEKFFDIEESWFEEHPGRFEAFNGLPYWLQNAVRQCAYFSMDSDSICDLMCNTKYAKYVFSRFCENFNDEIANAEIFCDEMADAGIELSEPRPMLAEYYEWRRNR